MIKGIFYSEFDNIAGPQIEYQAPPDVLSNETFDSVSGYIIIDKALCGKIITVCVSQLKIVGYPVCIEDDKYHRNALLFNIGFIFHEDVDTAPYRPILRKLGTLVESMEKESGFLHQKQQKQHLGRILPQILKDLTIYGECTIPVDSANIINLKLFPKLPDPTPVYDYQVPVPIRDLHVLVENCGEWDLALRQIVPHMDGVKYVRRIAIETNVELAIVKKCIQQLVYYGCITMIDIFLHSNTYVTTNRLRWFSKETACQEQCVTYVTKTGFKPRPFAQIFVLYCGLQTCMRLSKFCQSFAAQLETIDIRRFITFGLIHSIIRRVHRYPIYSPPSGSPNDTFKLSSSPHTPNGVLASNNAAATSNKGYGAANRSGLLGMSELTIPQGSALELDILQMMDGTHHTDEICCQFLIRYGELERLMMSNPHCLVVHK